ncbi:MAG: alpha/beta fold hydrolase [Campylobacterota bacterium]|nr:alpha/beta fold hydrolase [Campylobacterota bacterium]
MYSDWSPWIRGPWWLAKNLGKILFFFFQGVIVAVMIGFVLYLYSLPELSIWHTTQLDHRFKADLDIHTLEEYMALEDRLFDELNREIYAKLKPDEKSDINRYTKNSYSDPSRWSIQGNRTTELPAKDAKMGVLLLHGMSDSPYSLHAQATYLQKQGAWVVNMRMPGHGIIPSGLIELRWEDMARAIEIGMHHLKKKLGDRPLYIMGYSTGAPLALNYTMKALYDEKLALPSGLLFYSPAIGVTPAASLAVWQGRIGHLLGIDKLAWNSITPEYDPFKYGSFAVNAGDQVYRIAKEVREQMHQLRRDKERYNRLPPIISFASCVDSTVVVADTVQNLYNLLPNRQNTLVLFDVNHKYENSYLISPEVSASIKNLISAKRGNHYRLEMVTNRIENMEDSLRQITVKKDGNVEQKDLDLSWPKGIYSLSHLALPINADDPLYGRTGAPPSPGIKLGDVTLHGENHTLDISASTLQRQRWNPFHHYTKRRVLEFMQLGEEER